MQSYLLSGACTLRFCDEQLLQQGKEAPVTTIPGAIPGNVELDLMKQGILPDVFFGSNIHQLRDYEFFQWTYQLDFMVPETQPGERLFLHFHGVDCIADYRLNGAVFAHSENALIPHRFEITQLAHAGTNQLEITLHSPILYAAEQTYEAYEWAYEINHEALHVRKAPSQYGWDIMPRAVSAGIWRDVFLEVEGTTELTDLYLATRQLRKDSAEIYCAFSTRSDVRHYQDLSLRLVFCLDGETVWVQDHPLWFICGSFRFQMPNPRLWWPRGYGEAPVYQVTAQLLHKGQVLSEKATNFGIRTVELCRSEINDDSGGEFLFRVNGEPIFCRGSNWVPADAFHSRDAQRYEAMLEMFRDTNCNMLRCWGGNVYEDEAFFDICDRSGILVWQDFAMACGFYPQTAEFGEKFRQEVEAVVTRLRNHPSLALWSGDNECDAHIYAIAKLDPNDNILTREIIPSVIHRLNPERPYLPSSPFAARSVIQKGKLLKKTPESETWPPSEPYKCILPEDHPWGPRDYFKSNYYQNLRCCFLSELGYHGCNDIESMKTFLSPDRLWPWQHNEQWLSHAAEPLGENGPYAYRIKLMDDQIYELFGFHPDNLPDFVLASQISQAEAMKYFVESSRMLKWSRSGIIWWNMIDGWPQFSDAVVSYDFRKKLAYHYIRFSQQNVCLMMSEPGSWTSGIFAANDSFDPQHITYEVLDGETGAVLLAGTGEVPANTTVGLDRIPVSYGEQRLYLLRWTANGVAGKNHFIHGTPPFSFGRMKNWLRILQAFYQDSSLEETMSRIYPA